MVKKMAETEAGGAVGMNEFIKPSLLLFVITAVFLHAFFYMYTWVLLAC